MPRRRLIKLRQGTAAEWAAADAGGRYLAAGEPGWDSTNDVFKIGDGGAWAALQPAGAPASSVTPIPVQKSDGNLACGIVANTWHELDTTGSAADRNLDLVVGNVVAGQELRFTAQGASSSTAAHVYLDLWSMDNGVRVNPVGGGAAGGIPGWALVASAYSKLSGDISYTLQAADIVDGVARFRIWDYNTTTTARALAAAGGFIFRLEATGPFG